MSTVMVPVKLTPQQLAEQFWSLPSDEMADFYSALDKIAEHKLCMQTAYVVADIAQRQMKGDYSASNAFRTLHSHAEPYIEVLADEMAYEAKRAIAGVVKP